MGSGSAGAEGAIGNVLLIKLASDFFCLQNGSVLKADAEMWRYLFDKLQ